ncbi:DUF485 domain-containing protein [Chromobacterium rhizoryzae]|uniref:DUF485 domain-containing protein n=1 Tax=Chromobacterium rhizoryzae TaxID=1778675 RepID=UPI001D07B9DE|nr:DUF485 domain-containing protein [Chromobacterium rhizoryzae]
MGQPTATPPLSRRLAWIAAAGCLGYYLLLALRPAWLEAKLVGWPASVLLALAMFLLFFLLAAGYALAAGRADDSERA